MVIIIAVSQSHAAVAFSRASPPRASRATVQTPRERSFTDANPSPARIFTALALSFARVRAIARAPSHAPLSRAPHGRVVVATRVDARRSGGLQSRRRHIATTRRDATRRDAHDPRDDRARPLEIERATSVTSPHRRERVERERTREARVAAAKRKRRKRKSARSATATTAKGRRRRRRVKRPTRERAMRTIRAGAKRARRRRWRESKRRWMEY